MYMHDQLVNISYEFFHHLLQILYVVDILCLDRLIYEDYVLDWITNDSPTLSIKT